MIAREGFLLIGIGLVLTVLLLMGAVRWSNALFFVLSLIAGILTIFTVYFFRDPDRVCPDEPNILLAPADGKVVAIDTLADAPFIESPAIRVSIFLSVFDVHVNRVPASGRVEYVKYNPGKFLAAYEDKASLVNEQTEIGMLSDNGCKLVFKQIAGIIARRIVCQLADGQQVGAGERFGMIRFGSRADLIVPVDSDIRVRLGEHVAGGSSVIGYLPERTGSAREEMKAQGSDVEL